ncbi:hypothetical protein Mgra_00002819 [Meloidogyne graminicola]|uniref:Uncharacterized protein n=1 Tax=Meloidogyne graminicola TaxID=189291 RepID=A0A8S9ZXG1_9BILA|nr:hypothetical protein Mgra_00002819 [Meloidogyne graminicola]
MYSSRIFNNYSNKLNIINNIIILFSLLFLTITIENCYKVNSIIHHPYTQNKFVLPSILFTQRRHQNKRMAEIGKRERIILDSLGGNDFLIKRSEILNK